MSEPQNEMSALETKLYSAAREFPYPRTPAAPSIIFPERRQSRRPVVGWAFALLIALVLGAFAVPNVRAAVIEIIRIGVLQIFPEALPFDELDVTPTVNPVLRNLYGKTTLEQAGIDAGFPVLYPSEYGRPDEVYYQHIEGPSVLMIWLKDGELELSLLLLGPNAFAGKGAPEILIETRVNGVQALWLEGDHIFFYRDSIGDYKELRLFEAGNALVWAVGKVTYRLEGELTMAEAVRIAESLTGTP